MSSSKPIRILFLLRTYNDIDHIAPVIWKTVSVGWPTFFLFVDQDYSADYRIRFLENSGAKKISSIPIEWYDEKARHWIPVKLFRRVVDRLVAHSFGLFLLFTRRIGVIASEWGGPYGRARSEYFLRPANMFHIPVYSLPHGYFLWRNHLFNRRLLELYDCQGGFPDFSNRNWFTKYVVQSDEHKCENIKYGMNPEKLVVLGSARFCEEWSDINLNLLLENCALEKHRGFTVVFFLPHWDYNVNRDKCIDLLVKLSQKEDITLNIKAHTRGTGALTAKEIKLLSQYDNVKLPNDLVHSTMLVYCSDVIINFGSSIAFEALRQGKPVINPTYLHENGTFFDRSEAVIDVNDEVGTLRAIDQLKLGKSPCIEPDQVSQFLCDRLEVGQQGQDVLQTYVDLLAGKENIVRIRN